MEVAKDGPRLFERLRKHGAFSSGLLTACANPECASGWLHPLRGRSAPVFEGGWTCSAECTRARLLAGVAREMEGRASGRPIHRHRIPLGLLMLQNGWISQGQLRAALDAQKAAGSGRLGQWLRQQNATNEESVTRALGLQWSCPVMTVDGHDMATLTTVAPRFFVDAFGALPLRIAAGKVLYLGFEESLDPILAHAIGRMTGLRVECGVVPESQFKPAHTRMLGAAFPPVELIEATSRAAAGLALAKAVEKARPTASWLVRVHGYLWLRMWLRAQGDLPPGSKAIQDLVCSIGPI